MHVIAVLPLLAVAALSAGVAALTLRVLINLLRKGPVVADEAYEHGESLKSWYNANAVDRSLHAPRDGERFAYAARADKAYGEVMVEERASYPAF